MSNKNEPTTKRLPLPPEYHPRPTLLQATRLLLLQRLLSCPLRPHPGQLYDSMLKKPTGDDNAIVENCMQLVFWVFDVVRPLDPAFAPSSPPPPVQPHPHGTRGMAGSTVGHAEVLSHSPGSALL